MLIRFRVENFRSIREEQELSLVASPQLSERKETLVHAERYDFGLLRGAAIYGPNASGKSTLFAALGFMKTAVEESQRKWAPNAGVPRTPFALDPGAAKEPSLFAVDLLLDGIRYEYGFVVDSQRVLEEWLYAYPKGRKQEWFTRDASRGQEFAFSRHMQGENRTISGFTRPNSLFLSAAAQNNHAMLGPIYRWFSSHSLILEGQQQSLVEMAALQLCLDEDIRESVQRLMKAADLGITSLEIVEEDIATFAGRLHVPPDSPILTSFPFAPRFGGGVQLRHRAGPDDESVVLPFSDESQGTKAMFSLAGMIMGTLKHGGLLMVDELDRSLHSHLALTIVSLFQDPKTNPRNSQLIFNTHDTNLLDTRMLRRDQIWFTEKGNDGATRLFPMTDFRARKHENLERGYLQGRYGAVPSIGTSELLHTLAS